MSHFKSAMAVRARSKPAASICNEPCCRIVKTMKQLIKYILVGGMLSLYAAGAAADDLTISVSSPVSRHAVKFQCDQYAGALGLPAGPFVVEYLNGGGNSLAVLPIGGHSLIFAGVTSGSGARYAASRYIWWDAGSRGVHLHSDSLAGKSQSSCHRLP
jgi:membrane-bound inhibitor of C-type lysozyme